MKDIAVILLAAGQSTRFGGDKLLAELQGKPVMIHAAQMAARLPFGAHYAVTDGTLSRRLLLADAGFTVINNPNPENGQGSSLAIAAQQAIDAGFESALILLADMPLVTPRHIDRLMACAGDRVMSAAGEIVMPPALFRGTALTALTRLKHDAGAGQSVKSSAMTVPISPDMALDIDTAADLIKVETLLKRARAHG